MYEAIDVILEDVSGNSQRRAIAVGLAKAVKESDRNEQGGSLFGSDSNIGVFLLQGGYGVQVLGSLVEREASLREKVYRRLGFQLSSPEVPFYAALGRTIRERF